MPFAELTAELAAGALRDVGVHLAVAEVSVERREERWVVHLPDQRVAWFAASETGLTRLVTERRVLRLIASRCSLVAPRVLFESADGAFDVRTRVPGSCDPWRAYVEVRDDAELAARVGAAVGAMLAEQHARIGAADVASWLPSQPSWPESRAWVLERVARVIDDAALIGSADIVMRAYEAVVVADEERALVHTDVGLHNLGIDAQSYAVHGLFDYEGAAWADRHHDFRYLVFDFEQERVLDAALAVYEPLAGREIQRSRVFLYNAACALTFLAYRLGTPPEEHSCGRTLEQDLRWSRAAIARVLSARER